MMGIFELALVAVREACTPGEVASRLGSRLVVMLGRLRTGGVITSIKEGCEVVRGGEMAMGVGVV